MNTDHEFKAGEQYVALEGARAKDARDGQFAAGEVLTVRCDGIDRDGDVSVSCEARQYAYVQPQYLKPVVEPKSELDEAIDGLTKMAEGAGLDVRRIAASLAAKDTLGGTTLFGGPSAESIVTLASFLLGEEVPA